MSEQQIAIVVFIYVVIVLSIAVFISLNGLKKRLWRIEKLLISISEQYAKNKDNVSNGDRKNE